MYMETISTDVTVVQRIYVQNVENSKKIAD